MEDSNLIRIRASMILVDPCEKRRWVKNMKQEFMHFENIFSLILKKSRMKEKGLVFWPFSTIYISNSKTRLIHFEHFFVFQEKLKNAPEIGEQCRLNNFKKNHLLFCTSCFFFFLRTGTNSGEVGDYFLCIFSFTGTRLTTVTEN